MLFEEDFSSGFFDRGEIGSKADWFLYRQQDFIGRDPQTRLSFLKNRLEITIPEYSLTAVGVNDHIKFLFFRNTVNKETGFPGYAVPESGDLNFEVTAKVRTMGTEPNPFDVPKDDYRLSSGTLLSIDFVNFLVYGFLITENKAYVLYERWPYDDDIEDQAAFFSYIIPVIDLDPGTEHVYKTGYNRETNTISWFIDGNKVYQWDEFGKRLGEEADEHCVLCDLPDSGDPASIPIIESQQRLFGAGLITFLDAGMRQDNELVDIHDLNIEKEKKIFGQGGELVIGKFRIFTTK